MRAVAAFWSGSSVSGKLGFVWAAVSLALGFLALPFFPPGAVGLFVVAPPIAVVALLLRPEPVWSRALGSALSALVTFFFMFGSAEYVSGLQHGDALSWVAATFFAMFACGLIVTAAGLVNVAQAARSSSFWKRTPGASGLAFIACVYWLVVFVADTFLSANLPGLRWTMALILAVVLVLAAVALRSAAITARVLGLALTVGAGVATLLYWVAYADLLTMSGSIPSVPGSGYWTLIPWPVLLVIGLALDLSILVLGVRHLARQLPGPTRLA